MKETANINPKQLDYNLDFIIRKAATGPPLPRHPDRRPNTFTGGLDGPENRPIRTRSRSASCPRRARKDCLRARDHRRQVSDPV